MLQHKSAQAEASFGPFLSPKAFVPHCFPPVLDQRVPLTFTFPWNFALDFAWDIQILYSDGWIAGCCPDPPSFYSSQRGLVFGMIVFQFHPLKPYTHQHSAIKIMGVSRFLYLLTQICSSTSNGVALTEQPANSANSWPDEQVRSQRGCRGVPLLHYQYMQLQLAAGYP